MRHYSISPSKLDACRRYQEGFLTKEALVSMIKGEFFYTDYMRYGDAYHHLLEHGSHKYRNFQYRHHEEFFKVPHDDGFVYMGQEEVRHADIWRAAHPNATYEVSLRKTWKGYDLPVVTRMRIDAMEGNVNYDFKVGQKPFSMDFYYESLQWQCYQLATGSNDFVFVHFHCIENENWYNQFGVKDKPRFSITRRDCHFYLPRDAEDNIRLQIRNLIAFAHQNDLTEYLIKGQ